MLASGLSMFGANIFLLIGLLVALATAVALILGLWTGVKVWFWRREVQKSQEQFRRERYAPDGTPLPRATRGICEACNAPRDDVLHLPDGRRLCRRHYREGGPSAAREKPHARS